jgi:hypothetical protein
VEERPNVTVIYQTPASAPATLGAVIIELLVFCLVAGVIALAGGCTMLWW